MTAAEAREWRRKGVDQIGDAQVVDDANGAFSAPSTTHNDHNVTGWQGNPPPPRCGKC